MAGIERLKFALNRGIFWSLSAKTKQSCNFSLRLLFLGSKARNALPRPPEEAASGGRKYIYLHMEGHSLSFFDCFFEPLSVRIDRSTFHFFWCAAFSFSSFFGSALSLRGCRCLSFVSKLAQGYSHIPCVYTYFAHLFYPKVQRFWQNFENQDVQHKQREHWKSKTSIWKLLCHRYFKRFLPFVNFRLSRSFLRFF